MKCVFFFTVQVFKHLITAQLSFAVMLSAGSCPWHFVHTALSLNRSFTVDTAFIDAVSERHFLLLGFQEMFRFSATIKICCFFFIFKFKLAVI